jgi:hypothetical protein
MQRTSVVVEDDTHQFVGLARGKRHDGGVRGYPGELNKIYVCAAITRRDSGGYWCARSRIGF